MPRLTTSDPELTGVLVIDKPLGCTSRAVVNRINRWLGVRSAGHAGTLDPQASGILVVAVGEATKLIRWLQDAAKTYEVTIALGAATVSDDAASAIVATAPVPDSLSLAQIQAILDSWQGAMAQVPPQVSALQQDGVRDHQRVRRGETVDRAPRQVMLHRARVMDLDGPALQLEVTCGSGFYVRALARDLALALGTLGHVVALRRTAGSGFALPDALALEALIQQPCAAFADLALDLRTAIGRLLPALQVDPQTALMLRQGKTPSVAHAVSGLAVAVVDQELVAIVDVADGQATVVRGFAHTAVRVEPK